LLLVLKFQFWQKEHFRLQPGRPKESTFEPGKKWFNGFFSTGSATGEVPIPHALVHSLPSLACLAPQLPTSPFDMAQA
jgi:hypothetical protein